MHNHFPAAVNFGGKSGKVPYSWRVAILPYLEQQALYNAYNFDEPWDGPNNRKLIDEDAGDLQLPRSRGNADERRAIAHTSSSPANRPR